MPDAICTMGEWVAALMLGRGRPGGAAAGVLGRAAGAGPGRLLRSHVHILPLGRGRCRCCRLAQLCDFIGQRWRKMNATSCVSF